MTTKHTPATVVSARKHATMVRAAVDADLEVLRLRAENAECRKALAECEYVLLRVRDGKYSNPQALAVALVATQTALAKGHIPATPKCEHDYSKYEPIIVDGEERGETLVCQKCGCTAFQEAQWILTCR